MLGIGHVSRENFASHNTYKGACIIKLKSIIAASLFAMTLLALGSTKTFALDQSIDLSSGYASFIGASPLLVGGDDVLSFTGLATGIYNFDFSMSSQRATITSVLVNGQAATGTGFGVYRFFGLSSVDTSPFIVQIFGTATTSSLYSGELQVSAVSTVPEAGTYILMLVGLGMFGFAARRFTVS